MENIKSVILFPNGNTAVFNSKGEQMPYLQKSWIELWCEYMQSSGVDPSTIPDIKAIVNGREVYIQPFKVDNGWNWKIVPF